MKLFTRTISGLRNYSKFFGVDITVFIEGKKTQKSSDATKTIDQFYYEIVSKAVAPERKFKFKVLGNKLNVLKHAELISNSHGEVSALAIVDKDLDGFKLSILNFLPKLYYTYNYSWENDFLNYAISLDVLTDLTPIEADKSKCIFSKRFFHAKKRLELLSSLDAVLQVNCETIIPKNKSLGIAITDNDYVIEQGEVKRLVTRFKATLFSQTALAKQLLSYIKANSLKPTLVQGHLWCHTIIKIITDIYKRVTRHGSLTLQSVLNLLLSKFATNPLSYMSPSLKQHYTAIFNQ